MRSALAIAAFSVSRFSAAMALAEAVSASALATVAFRPSREGVHGAARRDEGALQPVAVLVQDVLHRAHHLVERGGVAAAQAGDVGGADRLAAVGDDLHAGAAQQALVDAHQAGLAHQHGGTRRRIDRERHLHARAAVLDDRRHRGHLADAHAVVEDRIAGREARDAAEIDGQLAGAVGSLAGLEREPDRQAQPDEEQRADLELGGEGHQRA
jgi:hypothetical protein